VIRIWGKQQGMVWYPRACDRRKSLLPMKGPGRQLVSKTCRVAVCAGLPGRRGTPPPHSHPARRNLRQQNIGLSLLTLHPPSLFSASCWSSPSRRHTGSHWTIDMGGPPRTQSTETQRVDLDRKIEIIRHNQAMELGKQTPSTFSSPGKGSYPHWQSVKAHGENKMKSSLWVSPESPGRGLQQ
jgi:hypothetical protein